MAVTLGIDFGTSYTFIVKKDKNDKLTVINPSLYSKMGNVRKDVLSMSYGIRSVIGFKHRDSHGDPVWCIGENAFNDCREENICKNLKGKIRYIFKGRLRGKDDDNRWLPYVASLDKIPQDERYGHTFYEHQDGTQVSSFFVDAITLSKIFLEIALDNHDDRGSGGHADGFYAIRDVERIVVGVPADEYNPKQDGDTSHNYNEEMHRILEKVKEDIKRRDHQDRLNTADIVIGAEPTLAVNAYIKNFPNETREGDYILVVDVGGGTADFVLVQRTADGYTIPYTSKGATNPAGEDFDNELETILGARGFSLKKEQIIVAKESLFFPRRLFDSNAEYERYKYCGRNHKVLDDNGKECWIAFNKQHDGGASNVIHFEPILRDVCVGTQKTLGITQKLEVYINEAYQSLHDEGKIKEDFLPIDLLVFAGGTCSMDELRENVVRAIGIQKRGDLYTFHGRNVGVLFWEVGEETKDAIPLTASNMIAIGAAFHRESEIAVSISDLTLWYNWVSAEEGSLHSFKKYTGWKNRFIFSQIFKNEGHDLRLSQGKWPICLCADPNDKAIEYRIQIGPYENNVYPRWGRSPYSMQFKDVPLNGLKLLFFVDVSRNGRLALFACKLDYQAKPNMSVVQKYLFKCLDGGEISISDVKGIHAIYDNFKMYPIKNPEETELRGQAAIKYSVNNDKFEFGWVTNRNLKQEE